MTLVTSYPGAPISGIVTALNDVPEEMGVTASWSTNEKVALEEAFGVSLAGRRALTAVKNVGLNAAMDALMLLAYTGCRGGLVLVVGDDPAGTGSATEQDSRFALRMADVLVLEPANSQEARDMTKEAFRLSEELELPVVIRITTRVCQMSSPVELGDIDLNRPSPAFESVDWHWSSGAGSTVERHTWHNERLPAIERFVESTEFNELTGKGNRLAVVTTGMAHNYLAWAVESLGLADEVSVLKIGTNPIPKQKVLELLDRYEKLLVVEELEPFIESEILSLRPRGCETEVVGKNSGLLPVVGEFSTRIVARALAEFAGLDMDSALEKVEERVKFGATSPRKFCPGCPHIDTLSAVKRAVEELGYDKYIAPADAGCLDLGLWMEEEGTHIGSCMGSAISIATGLVEAGIKEPVIPMVGDSAFFHTALPALVNAVWRDINVTVIVCDNSGAAMTGLQPSPTTVGVTSTSREVSIKEAALGCGVRFLEEFDPKDSERAVDCIKRGIAFEGPSLLISVAPCVKD